MTDNTLAAAVREASARHARLKAWHEVFAENGHAEAADTISVSAIKVYALVCGLSVRASRQ